MRLPLLKQACSCLLGLKPATALRYTEGRPRGGRFLGKRYCCHTMHLQVYVPADSEWQRRFATKARTYYSRVRDINDDHCEYTMPGTVEDGRGRLLSTCTHGCYLWVIYSGRRVRRVGVREAKVDIPGTKTNDEYPREPLRLGSTNPQLPYHETSRVSTPYLR